MKLKVIDASPRGTESLGREVYELAQAEHRLHEGDHHSVTPSSRDYVVKIVGGGSEPLAAAPAQAPTCHTPEVGQILDRRYRLDEEIGEGGICLVYKAWDLLLAMTVAVKVLKPEASTDPDFVQTLLDEARMAMQLSHSQIVRLHTLQETAGFYYLVMEHIDGQTLRECLGDYDRLPLETVGQIIQACHPPLRHAHKRGVLHNDLKPDNLLLCDSATLKVLDFGLSCLANQPTRDHALLGTPAYMSPERMRRETLDPRSDIYSLSLTAYELLTGRLPFPEGLAPDDYADAHPLEMPDAPEAVRPILLKATAFDRRERWETLDEFVTAFVEVAGG